MMMWLQVTDNKMRMSCSCVYWTTSARLAARSVYGPTGYSYKKTAIGIIVFYNLPVCLSRDTEMPHRHSALTVMVRASVVSNPAGET